MITEKKPKPSVVELLNVEHGYRVIKRPADDAETLFRRLYKQVTNTDTTIPRDDVEKCFRAAGLPPASDPSAIRTIVSRRSNSEIKSSPKNTRPNSGNTTIWS